MSGAVDLLRYGLGHRAEKSVVSRGCKNVWKLGKADGHLPQNQPLILDLSLKPLSVYLTWEGTVVARILKAHQACQ